MATGTKAYLCFIFTTAASVKQKARALSFLLLIQLQDGVPLPCFSPLYIFISLSLTSLILVFFCVISSPCILLHFMSSFLTKAILFFFFPLCIPFNPLWKDLQEWHLLTSSSFPWLPIQHFSSCTSFLFQRQSSDFPSPNFSFLLPQITFSLWYLGTVPPPSKIMKYLNGRFWRQNPRPSVDEKPDNNNPL